MLSGARLEDTRRYNCRVIFDIIRQKSPITRVEISEITGLTTTAISSLTKELLELDLIVETGRRKGQRGQPAVDLEINPTGRFSVGFDLGPQHLSGVIINLAGDILEHVYETWSVPPPQITLPRLAEQFRHILKKAAIPVENLAGLGMAVTGAWLSDKNHKDYFVKFPEWEKFPIAEELEKLVGIRPLLENNGRAAAIGEQFHGEGRQYDEFFFLYFSYGLGGAMITGGRPYQWFCPHGAQLGRIRQRSGPRHILGLEPLYDFLRTRGINVSEPKALEPLFLNRDPHFWEWLERAVEQLDTIIGSVNALFRPQAIFFGGDLPDVIIDSMIQQLDIAGAAIKAADPHSSFVEQAKLLPATSIPLSGALGAATLPLYALFGKRENPMRRSVSQNAI